MLTLPVQSAAAFRNRRAARQEQNRLAAELATYRTDAERAELDAMLARHSDDETAAVRQLIG